MGTDDERTKLDGDHATTVPAPRNRHAIQRAVLPERYKVTELLGEGGMGEVLAARDGVIGREVAIKRMLEADPSAAQTSRFMREARIQGTLDHPAIPPVHELAHDADGRPYFVMKRLKGTTLSKLLADGRSPRERLLRAFADVCLAVELAHTRGIVHRDLKPSNIMLGGFGEVFVLDWGVAKVVAEGDPALDMLRTTPADSTELGIAIGTPVYMAPEQQAGLEIDGRADVYSLGCVLFEILAGKRLKTAGVDRPSQAAPRHQVPPELDDLCVEATMVDVQARLGTARELGERVQHYLDGDRDLAVRSALATEHLARAMRASTIRDQEGQRVAIQEAARALALDPQLPGAADFVGRLMLEPPATMPPEVDEELAAADQSSWAKLTRVLSLGYSAFAGFIPIMLWIGVRDPTYLVLFMGVLVGLSAIAWLSGRRRSSLFDAIMVIGCALHIALLAHMFSPFLIAPGIAAMNVMIMTGSVGFRRNSRIVALVVAMQIGALAPWVLELVGAIRPTMSFNSTHLLIQSPVLENNPIPVQIGLALYVITLLIAAALIRRAHAIVEDTSRRQLHLHAWQLRQLVPA